MLSNPNKVLWKKVFHTNNSDPETIPRLYKIVISKKLNKNTGAVLGSWNVFNSLECKNELLTVAFSSRKLQVRVKCVWNALDCVISWEVLLLLVRQVGRVHLLLQPLLHPRILRPTPGSFKMLVFACCRIIPNVCCLLAAGSFQMFFVGPDHSKCYYTKFWNLEMHYLLYWGAGSFLMFCPFVVTDNSEGFW